MKRTARLLMVGGIAVLLSSGVAVLITHHPSLITRPAAQKALYYCPMHPTYTSDRPGDCPICNMKLVKREQQEVNPQSAIRNPQSVKDICYLHNCPMVREGKPCPMLVVAKEGERVSCPICGTHVAEAARSATSKKILYWTDPMIPGYKSDQPGTSPMGMGLIPVYEENGAPGVAPAASPEGYAPILVTPQKQQFIGVTTALAERRSLTKTIRTVGVIAHDPELYQAQEEFLQAARALERAQAGSIPEIAERAGRLVESSRLRLRHLGLSEEMIEEIGGWTEPDHRLLLGGRGQLWVYAPLYEYELPLARMGQAAAVEVNALPGRTFPGTVRAIDPMLDQVTRTARVRILIEDPEHILKPGMFVNASIVVAIGEVLAIPEEAVFQTGTKQIVFVDQGRGLLEPRDVTVGVKADGSYEVKAGIGDGERVVTSGNFLIDSESRLKAALEGMSGGEHQHGQ